MSILNKTLIYITKACLQRDLHSQLKLSEFYRIFLHFTLKRSGKIQRMEKLMEHVVITVNVLFFSLN